MERRRTVWEAMSGLERLALAGLSIPYPQPATLSQEASLFDQGQTRTCVLGDADLTSVPPTASILGLSKSSFIPTLVPESESGSSGGVGVRGLLKQVPVARMPSAIWHDSA